MFWFQWHKIKKYQNGGKKMKIPISLIIISVLIIITGVLRIFVGIFGMAYIENPGMYLTVAFYLDNLLFGILAVVSGVLILLSKKQGMIIYTISVVLLFIFYLAVSGILRAINYTILPVILLIILIIIVKVTGYFKK